MRIHQVRLILFYYAGVVRYNLLLTFFAGVTVAMASRNDPFSYAVMTFATAGFPGAVWFHGLFHRNEFFFYANHHLSKRMLIAGAAIFNTLVALPAIFFIV